MKAVKKEFNVSVKDTSELSRKVNNQTFIEIRKYLSNNFPKGMELGKRFDDLYKEIANTLYKLPKDDPLRGFTRFNDIDYYSVDDIKKSVEAYFKK